MTPHFLLVCILMLLPLAASNAEPASAYVAPTQDELEKAIAHIAEHGLGAEPREILDLPNDTSDELVAVFVDNVTTLYGSQDYVSALAKFMVSQQHLFMTDSGAVRRDVVASLAAEWSAELASLGMERLPLHDQRANLLFSTDIIDHHSADECSADAAGLGSQVALTQAERAYLLSLPPDEVAEHLGRTRRAILAQLHDHPPVTPLTFDEETAAGLALSRPLMDAIRLHPESAALYDAMLDDASASPAIACELYRLTIATALEIEGEVGDLVVRLMSVP